jgi:hypothetical protein
MALLGFLRTPCAWAADFMEGFDGDETSWTIRDLKSTPRPRMLSHRRHQIIRRPGGRASESLVFDVSRQGTKIELEHPLPPARVLYDELKLSLWFRSSRNGPVLWLRVIFPNQKDPSTGATLSTYIQGDAYTKAGKWQQLQCVTGKKQVQRRIRETRYRLDNPKLDTSGMYVDQVILSASLEPGTVKFFVDELRFGPVVHPKLQNTIRQSSHTEREESPPFEFRLGRLLVNEKPFFPRITSLHSESLQVLKESGVNVVWIPDYQDEQLLDGLRQHRLWGIATPPRAMSHTGQVLDPQHASILPFSEKTAPILCWYQGTRISGGARQQLIDWNKQIRNADQNYERPIMADVTGLERIYSRYVEMLGVSRHAINTSFSIKSYRDWLLQKRKMARSGSFVWTWIQTEPVSANAKRRQASQFQPIVIEPEQIRMQVYAALAAGCRGIGYWKTASLDVDDPAAIERRLVITQLNLELELLAPWLSTGTLIGQVPFEVNRSLGPAIGRGNLDFRNSQPERKERDALRRERENQLKRAQQIDSELEAAVIRSDRGDILLLPIWYENGAQFVPGQMVANDATIVVRGADESASAWEVTTTGIRNLASERVAGGIRITLPKFDQTTAVILTPDRNFKAKMSSKIKSMAMKSSRVSVELAKAKLERVRKVDEELQELNVGQPDAPQLLAKAAKLVKRAEHADREGNHHLARQRSADARQLLRILQRSHWDDAVRTLGSAVSSPHTVCFQTLPDHWRMIARIGRSPVKAHSNLLRSGDLEDIDTMIADGWKHSQNAVEGVRAAAELYPVARQGKSSLRLIAVP